MNLLVYQSITKIRSKLALMVVLLAVLPLALTFTVNIPATQFAQSHEILDHLSSVQTPDLVILDLNLPGKDGREVLAEIKSEPILKTIPVIVLFSSGDEEDILKCYKLSANCYISKPVDVKEFFNVIHMITDFWITIAKLLS